MKIVNSKSIKGINHHCYGGVGFEDFFPIVKRFLLFVSHKIFSFDAKGEHSIAIQPAFVKISRDIILEKQYANENRIGIFRALKIMDYNTVQVESFQFGELITHRGIHYLLKSNFHFKKNIYSNIY